MHALMPIRGLARTCALAFACACGGGSTPTPDANTVTTENCTYVPMVPTAHAGMPVETAALTAGAAERVLDIPVGTALGGYTARAGFLGSSGVVDTRTIKMSGTFNPSIGIVNAPRVKALALTSGVETVVILKVDMIFTYEGMLYDLEQRLGPEYAGKVLLASSHSHSAWAQYTAHGPLKLGAGEMRELVYTRMLDAFEAAARDALAARRPARLGVSYTDAFDPQNIVNHDRRGDNDTLPGGDRKDDHLFVVRVDGTDATPIGALVIVGEHGTLNGEDNPFASTDAPGALERTLQEQFATPMVVMHLQSAGGDNSPSGHGGLDCSIKPGKATDPCFAWASEEGHGRAALPLLLDAYTKAGTAMQAQLPLAMVSRTIELGPSADTFAIRDGALTYAPFDSTRLPDRQVYASGTSGPLASPIDEFDAPVGAALCQDPTAMFPSATIDGTDGLAPYGSCLRLDLAGEVLGPIFKIDFKVDATHPVCETTRTTISALRIGDYVVGTMPGELTVMLANYLRTKSPVDEAHTILVGYAQGHVGYMLRPEDWMMGGYEPSVTFWGPLEAEHVGEQLLALLPSALQPDHADGTTATARVAVPTMTDPLEIDDPAPEAGTVPAIVPPAAWVRTGTPAQAQPDATIPRVAGVATFVFYGDDPAVKTPHVTLQRDAGSGFVDVARTSGRIVDDLDLTRAYTPIPLQRTGPQHHVWVIDWQAVPWLGAPGGLDALAARAGVPLGAYRFHVEGKGWTLDSQPFTVVPGGLEVAAQRGTSAIAITARLHAPKGWRLLDLVAPSNQPVAYAQQQVTVVLRNAANTIVDSETITLDGNGAGSTSQAFPTAITATITDDYGNTATHAIQ